ncbi:MAG: GNAT family N-acetyltransferase [Gammaproteobacteria bacterium]|nr:GNAT family N-acetyltransferase [Gammaproteobacteria bacterium]
MNQIFNSFDDVYRFKKDWNAIALNSANPMLCYDWFKSAFDAFNNEDKLFIFCVTEGNELVSAAPLYQKNKDGKHGKLYIIGNLHIAEPTSLIFKNEAALIKLFDFITSHQLALEFNRLPIKFKHIIKSSKNKRTLTHNLITNGSQFLTNITDMHSFESTMSSRRKSDLRRSRKRLNELGDSSYKIWNPSTSEIENVLDIAFKIENSGWKQRNNSTILSNKHMKQFIMEIFKKFSNGVSTVGLLYSNNAAIACNLSFTYAETLWIIKIGYIEEYKRCSPGTLLTHEMIRYCCENNITNIEFLGSKERWIELWRPNERKYMTFLYYPVSYSGLKAIVIDFLEVVRGKIRRTLKSLG